MSVINEVGILALSTRLQRLSEQLRKDGVLVYKHFGIDFEPRFFPVVVLLQQKKLLSVVEIAGEIGYTHPSTISLLKVLEKRGVIKSQKDDQDERKRLIELSAKGHRLIRKMEPVWDHMKAVLQEISDNDNHLLKAIEEAEDKIATQSFYQRILQLKNAKGGPA